MVTNTNSDLYQLRHVYSKEKKQFPLTCDTDARGCEQTTASCVFHRVLHFPGKLCGVLKRTDTFMFLNQENISKLSLLKSAFDD